MARKSFPLRTDTDTPEMRDAVEWCVANNISFERKSQYQIKVGHLNYYPDRETIQFDGKKKLPYGTFEKFKRMAKQNREWRKGHLRDFGEGVDDE